MAQRASRAGFQQPAKRIDDLLGLWEDVIPECNVMSKLRRTKSERAFRGRLLYGGEDDRANQQRRLSGITFSLGAVW